MVNTSVLRARVLRVRRESGGHFACRAGSFPPGGPYAHISPVGACDEKIRRVLIFDVDRQWYEPYWAADVQVLRAMSAKTKAFGQGGYVVLRKGGPQ